MKLFWKKLVLWTMVLVLTAGRGFVEVTALTPYTGDTFELNIDVDTSNNAGVGAGIYECLYDDQLVSLVNSQGWVLTEGADATSVVQYYKDHFGCSDPDYDPIDTTHKSYIFFNVTYWNGGPKSGNLKFVGIQASGFSNVLPVAYGQNLTTPEDTNLNITLTGFDVDGDPLSFSLLNVLTEPAHGTLTGTAPNLHYMPDLDYVGTDSFTFKVNDGYGDSTVATINITVTPQNDAPIAHDQNLSTPEDTNLDITLTGLDVDGDLLSYILLNILVEPAHGTLTGTGSDLHYLPDLNYVGPDYFTFKVNDGSVDSSVATISITVTPVNDAPVAYDQALSTDEDIPLNITLTGFDIEGDLLSYILLNTLTQPAHGTLTGTGASLVYTPDANYVGTDSFTFKVNDGSLDSNVATISIKVDAVNDAPVADDQTLSTNEDTPLNITLTGMDIDGDLLTYILLNTLTEPAHGTLTGTGASLVYTPDADFVGFDSFTFKVNDGSVDSNIATISINVGVVNDAPVAHDQSLSTNEDTLLNITLTGFDIDGDLLTFILLNTLTEPAHGTLSGTGASLVYTPDLNYVGTDSFTFKVNDGSLDSNIATISIKVDAVNDAPVADDQNLSTPEDTPLDITLTGFDVEGDLLTFILLNTLTEPVHGTLSGTGASLVYTPDANYFGFDSFTFKVNDGSLDSAVATIQIKVTAVNDIPVADDQNLSTPEDTPLDITLTGFDVEGDLLTFILLNTLTEPAHGTLTGTGASLVYTPDANYVGFDSFTFKVNDGSADSNVATISITVTAVNDIPVADDQNLSTPEETPLDITLTGFDVEGDLLTFILLNTLTEPAHGTLSGTGASLVYTPDLDFVGMDSFTFKVNDGSLDSAVATISITVTTANDAPVANDQTLSTPEDTLLNITLTGVDIDGDLLAYILLNTLTEPAHGTLTGTGANLQYVPDANYVGTDSFTFKVNDGTVDSNFATISITVTAVNDAPVANGDAFILLQGTAHDGTLIVSDVDLTDPITYILVSAPLRGTVVINPDGTYRYTHNGVNVLPDSFTYKVNDGTTDSNIATVNITVRARPVVNNAPGTLPETITVIEGGSIDDQVEGFDIDGDAITFILVTDVSNGVLQFNADGEYTYTHNGTETITDTFSFRTFDGKAYSAIRTATITITPVNDAPVAVDGEDTTDFETPLNGNINGLISDVDSTSWTIGLVGNVAHGTLVLNANGTFTYTPNAGFFGEDSFTFKANDGALDSNIAKYTITVDEEVIIVDPETPLSPLDFWWAYLLGLLLLLLFFLRPNLKYALVDKEGKEKVIRRHIFANGKDDLYVDLNDKGVEGLVAIDLVVYKQLAKREQGKKITFNLFKKPVKVISVPEDQDEKIEDQIKF